MPCELGKNTEMFYDGYKFFGTIRGAIFATILFVLVGCNAELMIDPGELSLTPKTSSETINGSSDELDNTVCIDLNIKVFLEGPYNTTSDEMDGPFNNPGCPLLPGLTPSSGSYADPFCSFSLLMLPQDSPTMVHPGFTMERKGIVITIIMEPPPIHTLPIS